METQDHSSWSLELRLGSVGPGARGCQAATLGHGMSVWKARDQGQLSLGSVTAGVWGNTHTQSAFASVGSDSAGSAKCRVNIRKESAAADIHVEGQPGCLVLSMCRLLPVLNTQQCGTVAAHLVLTQH